MRFKFLFILTCFTCNILSQENLTPNAGPASTSLNNAQCIATIDNYVHVVWTDSRSGIERIFYRRSDYNGYFWEDEVQLSDGWESSSYPSIAVINHEVYVVWMDQRDGNNEIYYKKSFDDGTTWGPDIRLTNDAAESSYPSLAVSNQSVHVVWQDDRNSEFEIYYKKSTDGGIIWQQDVRLTTDLSTSISPSIAVYDTSIHVVWQRDNGGIYYKHSLDNGAVWSSTYKVNASNSFAEQPMITLSETMVFVFWSDKRTGYGDIYMKRSVDNGNSWENDLKVSTHTNQAFSPRAASNGTYVYLLWTEMIWNNWAILTEFSTDAGVSWSGPGVSFLSQGFSTRPFISLHGREVHTICTDKTNGIDAIFYFRDDSGDPFLNNNDFVFGHGFGNSGNDKSYDLVIDGSGNVYMTGTFENIVDFDNGPGKLSLNSAGSRDVFIAKYDPKGEIVWARSVGGTGDDEGHATAVDNNGNVYITGYFNNVADFDPGASSHPLVASGQGEIFVLKLDLSGNFVWVSQMGGLDNDAGLSIAIDRTGNILTTGFFHGIGDFDPSGDLVNLSSEGMADIFITMQDPSGHLIWAHSIGGFGMDAAHSITTDSIGSIILTGYYSDTVDFDPGPGQHVLQSQGLKDIFVLKLNNLGVWNWSASFGAIEDDEGNAVTCDKEGNIYSTGYFKKKVDFDPDTTVHFVQSGGWTNPYVSKLDSHGHFLWAINFHGYSGEGKDIAIDRFENVYTTGEFPGGTDFDPGNLQLFLIANYQDDVYISKLSREGNFEWVNQLSGWTSSTSTAIAMGSTSDIYCAGYYYDNLDLDPTLGIDLIESSGSSDIFLMGIKQCEPSSSVVSVTACERYLAPDMQNVWTVSGTYESIIPTTLGCDSVITVHLIISNTDETDIVASTCNQFISPEGSIWNTSGIYIVTLTNINGCDSIVSYNVTIMESTEVEIVATACNEYSTADGSKTWTASGVYQQVYTNLEGCDSTVTYNLTIFKDIDTLISITACDRYFSPDGLHSWDSSGLYLYTIPTLSGCDSNITLNLLVVDIDSTVSVSSNELIANQIGGNYQWIDCNDAGTVIPGEIFQTFIPSISGVYGVILDWNGCVDTSFCYPVNIVGINEIYSADKITVYPNPAHELLNFDLTQQYKRIIIEISNLDGRVLKSATFNDKQYFQYSHALPPGLYFVSIRFDETYVIKKVVLL